MSARCLIHHHDTILTLWSLLHWGSLLDMVLDCPGNKICGFQERWLIFLERAATQMFDYRYTREGLAIVLKQLKPSLKGLYIVA